MNPTPLTDTRDSPSPALSRWLARLEQLDPNKITLGLERVASVLDRLALAKADTTITIAGTNGKGSSAVLLDRLLRATGRTVGRYTSPHLQRFNERIVVNGNSVDDAALVAAFEKVESARKGVALSYFEFTTLAAFVVFASADVDAWVLEIGLGGRLDAVNVVAPDACLLTSIGLDHQQWLGNDLDSIGREKAAIFRAAKPAIIVPVEPPDSVLEVARAAGAQIWRHARDFGYASSGGDWCWHGGGRRIDGLPVLSGTHQLDNASGCLAVMASLGLLDSLDDPAVIGAVAACPAPGRLEQIAGEPELLLDVSHNIDSIDRLAVWLTENTQVSCNTLVFGAMRDKAIEDMLTPLVTKVHRWIGVQAPGARPMPAGEVAARMAQVAGQPALVGGTPLVGYRAALQLTPPDGRIIVAGSFPVVGAVRGRL